MPIVDIPGLFLPSFPPIMLCFSHIKLHPCASFPPSLLPYTPAELVTWSFTATPSSLLAFLTVATVICVIACPSTTLLKGPFGSHGTQASYGRKATNEGLTWVEPKYQWRLIFYYNTGIFVSSFSLCIFWISHMSTDPPMDETDNFGVAKKNPSAYRSPRGLEKVSPLCNGQLRK